jgi:hypothetical protein
MKLEKPITMTIEVGKVLTTKDGGRRIEGQTRMGMDCVIELDAAELQRIVEGKR